MKRLKALGIVLSAPVVMGAAIASDHPPKDAVRDATPLELAAIKTSLELDLKDAQSARLQDVRVKGEKFCGFVNSKNSYGAYAGYIPIMGMLLMIKGVQTAYVFGIDSPEVTRAMCKDWGLPLRP
ncbi:MAG: hypothetical protein JSS44_08985 [Proteobacteria bacterium]|nr:hypothetical protein [Pseudomonadota bacterium]MBS0461765.1 hypothetical protein [Pseudomonadota bacterium]MBS0499371.1 hypothetical protein [Pseudomonadota bacterium]